MRALGNSPTLGGLDDEDETMLDACRSHQSSGAGVDQLPCSRSLFAFFVMQGVTMRLGIVCHKIRTMHPHSATSAQMSSSHTEIMACMPINRQDCATSLRVMLCPITVLLQEPGAPRLHLPLHRTGAINSNVTSNIDFSISISKG